MTLLWLVGLFAMFISPLQAHEEKDITVTQLLSSTITSSGQPIVLPQKDAQIVVSIHDAMPGATLQAHNHPYPRYVYVLSGNLQVNNIETGQTDTYKAGNFILEPVGGSGRQLLVSGASRSSCWLLILSSMDSPTQCS